MANQASGAISEALFLPAGARQQVRLPHPGESARRPTIADYEMPADVRVFPGRRNFVEQKSDLLSGETMTDRSAADVALARAYVADAVLDAPGIAGAPAVTWPGFEAPAGGVHLIEFVRRPNDVTRDAMLDVLLAPGSPFEAARIGGGDWITKAQWLAQRGGSSQP